MKNKSLSKYLIVIMCVLLSLVICGCSNNKKQNKWGSWQGLFTNFSNTQTTQQNVERVNKDLVRPAMDILHKYLQEEKAALKKNNKPETYAQLAKDNVKNLEKLKSIRADLQKEDVMKMTDKYIFFSRLYLDRAIQRLDTVSKIAVADKTKKQGLINSLRHIDGRLLVEAKYGYDNAYKVLVDGEGTYQLNGGSYRRIKKNQSYEQIMSFLKMPGDFMPGYSVVNNGKKEYHNPVVWADGDRYVYVDFVNGKAATWKCNELEGFKCR